MKLVAIGCSFTEHYMRSRTYPSYDLDYKRWPAHLAENLNMECINLGLSGRGNEYMLSKAFDASFIGDIGLVVVMWSEFQRMDYEKKEERGGWRSFHPHLPIQAAEEAGLMAVNKKMLEYKNPTAASLQSLRFFSWFQFMMKNIPYLQIQGADPLPVGNSHNGYYPLVLSDREESIKAIIDSDYYDLIDENKFIGWPIFKEIGGYTVEDVLPDNCRIGEKDRHPNAIGHEIIAQKIFENYDRIY
ncbi:MAG: hypothetical protein QGH83_12390 [Candidatus Pacebacteria bacterium]|jgi:hypothetical protein|nr:hypothetical protein [Candidatus Paceibacterota bacterium]|tara:strand:- start:1627 stop:2358 length:732 start_codon:yes stop_codon:yes gene_type:complete